MKIDVKQTKDFLNGLLRINKIVEIRMIAKQSGYDVRKSGYFTNTDTAIKSLLDEKDYDNGGIYFVMNKIAKPDTVMAREQANKLIKTKDTTNDKMIERYQWLFVDIDRENAVSGTSSSNEELTKLKEIAKKVYGYMRQKGFAKPIVAMSGNGYHLLYRIDMPNTEETKQLITKVLKVLSIFFSNQNTKIDTVNSNPARLCKLYGTWAKKGSETETRKFREAQILSYGDGFETINNYELLLSIADELPKEEPKRTNISLKNSSNFNIKDFFAKHGITVVNETSVIGGTKYELAECPFNPDHNKDHPAVFDFDNGGQEFKCFHNSCSGNHWKEFRLFYEPNAYDTRQALPNSQKEIKHDFKVEDILNYSEKIDEKAKALLRPSEIFNSQKGTNEFIPTGFKELDKLLGGGLQKTFLTILTGLSGGGKSTFCNQMVINILEKTNAKVVYYSGELTAEKLLWWLEQNIGGDYLKYDHGNNEKCYLEKKVGSAITNWLDKGLSIYNNDIGQGFDVLTKTVVEGIEEKKADIIIIDNLTSVDKSMLGTSNDKYDSQSKLVNSLKEIAKRCNVHIVLLVHLRKTSNLPRVEDISGSGDIRNLADNVLILHQNTEEFKRRVEIEYGKDNHFIPSFSKGADMYLEIAKDRDFGNKDRLIPLYYNKATRRILNDPTERKTYSWEEELLNLPF